MAKPPKDCMCAGNLNEVCHLVQKYLISQHMWGILQFGCAILWIVLCSLQNCVLAIGENDINMLENPSL